MNKMGEGDEFRWQEINWDLFLYNRDRAFGKSGYDAYPLYWEALLSVANQIPGSTEHSRAKRLLRSLPQSMANAIVGSGHVDSLIELDPPLGGRASSPLEGHEIEERGVEERVAKALDLFRGRRESHPQGALEPLYTLLAHIRHARMHLHKSPADDRDKEILVPACAILNEICEAFVTMAGSN